MSKEEFQKSSAPLWLHCESVGPVRARAGGRQSYVVSQPRGDRGTGGCEVL